MSFSEYDVTRRTRKGNFLKQIDQLIDWGAIEKAITVHYAPVDATASIPHDLRYSKLHFKLESASFINLERLRNDNQLLDIKEVLVWKFNLD